LQGTNAIALGYQSGYSNQGQYALAIGAYAGRVNQGNNSIVINASGTTLNNTTASSCKINPIREAPVSSNYNILLYDSVSSEVIKSTVTSAQNKTFVIDHPIDEDKYLVHACVESPDTELIYRGKSEISNNEYINIKLPEYSNKIGYNWSVSITSIGKKFNNLSTSEIDNGEFTVYGNNGKFYWIVYGKRTEFDIEPCKNSVEVKGDGPYKWL
jgi:hypothetical protein